MVHIQLRFKLKKITTLKQNWELRIKKLIFSHFKIRTMMMIDYTEN